MDGSAVEELIWRLLDRKKHKVTRKKLLLTESEIRSLCVASKEVFLSQPNLLRLEAPINVCSDELGDGVQLSQRQRERRRATSIEQPSQRSGRARRSSQWWSMNLNPGGIEHNVGCTPTGLLFIRPWNNLQYASGVALFLTIYSDVLSARGGGEEAASAADAGEVLAFARSEADYILGTNPMGTNNLIVYGSDAGEG